MRFTHRFRVEASLRRGRVSQPVGQHAGDHPAADGRTGARRARADDQGDQMDFTFGPGRSR